MREGAAASRRHAGYAAAAALFVLALALLAGCRSALSIGELFTYEPAEGGIAVTGIEGSNPSALLIPEEIDGEPVVGIAPWAFDGEEGVTSVVIPDTVEWIGDDAFSGCSALSSVQLPDGLREIGEEAFAFCMKLARLELPDSVESIGPYAFWNCRALRQVTVPDAVTVLPDGVFGFCYMLAEVEFPAGLEEIGDLAFRETALQTAQIPDSVRSVGLNAFGSCGSLESVHLPPGLTEISDELFADCTKLASVELPDGVVRIGAVAFHDCESLRAVHIPKTVRDIGEMAFRGCSSLSSVRIPDGVTVIRYATFLECYGLEEVSIPVTVRVIEPVAFYNTDLHVVYYAGSEAEWDRISIEEMGWVPSGDEAPNSNGPLLRAQVQFETEEPALPAGVRIRRYSRLWIESEASETVYLRGMTAALPGQGLSTQGLLGQFIIPATVGADLLSCEGIVKTAQSTVATGDILRFRPPRPQRQSVLVTVVDGDVTGSGELGVTQLVRIAAAFNGTDPLEGPYLMAGDFSGSGSIQLSDIVREAELWHHASGQGA